MNLNYTFTLVVTPIQVCFWFHQISFNKPYILNVSLQLKFFCSLSLQKDQSQSLSSQRSLFLLACDYISFKRFLNIISFLKLYSCSGDDVYTSLCVVVGVIVVVKMEGPSYVCKTDEVGEICVSSEATGSQYWGLAGLTNSAFKVQALLADGKPLSDALYTRSGLLGFLGPVSSA